MDDAVHSWQHDIFAAFGAASVSHVGYVPDAGHKGLIQLCQGAPDIATSVLTTEEEGIGLCAGLHLGGQRGVLLMQSSGVGNCVNMVSLAEQCRFPLVMLVTMRGQWAEFVPWQISMGGRMEALLKLLDFDVYTADEPDRVKTRVEGALDQAFFSNRRTAVLLGQSLIGRKNWGASTRGAAND